MTAVLLLVPIAYLVGTFPAAAVIARATGHDVLTEGSGNPGASNVYRLAGWKPGLIVLLIDIGKGVAASAVGLALHGHVGAYVLGFAAVLGHVAPITRRLRGGRGVATAGGVLIVLYPLVGLAIAVLWFVLARVIVRKASVASIVGAAAFPVGVAITGNSWGDVVITAVLAAVVIVRHTPNLRRLVRGQELGLGEGGGDTVHP